MEHLNNVHNQIVGVDDKNNWNDLQSSLCSVIIVSFLSSRAYAVTNLSLQSVVRRLNEGVQPLADRIMTIMLQLISAAGKTSTVLEDAFFVVGSLASGMFNIIQERDTCL